MDLINVNEIAKTAGITVPDQVVDPDTGEVLEMDYIKFKRGISIISNVRRHIFQMAKDIHEFFGEKYYLYYGMSKEEASQKLFGLNVSTIKNYQLIYEKLGSKYEEFEYLGISKLKELSKIPEEEREQLLEEGELKLADGTILTINEITEQSTKKLREKLRAETLANKKLRNELNTADEEHKAEVKTLKKEIKELDNLLNIEEKDQHFYRKITKLRETRDLIQEVEALLYTAYVKLAQVEISEENEQCTADIRSVLAANAEKILNAESYLGISLGSLTNDLEEAAH